RLPGSGFQQDGGRDDRRREECSESPRPGIPRVVRADRGCPQDARGGPDMTPPLSLYVHLPWCVRKCPYCDFNSHTAGGTADKQRYLDALVRDIQQEGARAGERLVGSVFFGGGTPSYFDAREIGRLLEAIASSLRLATGVEVTMEANPGTVERDRLEDYRRAGVNRLSLGAQSFDDESLRRLGRIHGSEEIRNAFGDAVKAGFTSVNIDLMYALP